MYPSGKLRWLRLESLRAHGVAFQMSAAL